MSLNLLQRKSPLQLAAKRLPLGLMVTPLVRSAREGAPSIVKERIGLIHSFVVVKAVPAVLSQ